MLRYWVMNRVLGVILFGLFGGPGVAATVAAPQADLVTSSWQLDFEFHDPQRIILTLPGDEQPTTFWYLLYRVTNDSRGEVEFYPSFRLVTDTLQVVEGGDMISPRVYDAIAARHKKEYPFFAPPSKVTGPLLQGRENARVSAAVFRVFDEEADSFTVYVRGLSGELERIPNPVFNVNREESEDNPRFFLFQRTLAITYDLPGDPRTRARAVPIRRNREWVMR